MLFPSPKTLDYVLTLKEQSVLSVAPLNLEDEETHTTIGGRRIAQMYQYLADMAGWVQSGTGSRSSTSLAFG